MKGDKEMLYGLHLYFYSQNKLSELLPGDPENVGAFLEDLANQKLRGFRPGVILIANAAVSFEPWLNIYILRFRIWCLYSHKTDVQVLKSIDVEVEDELSMALLELFGGELPLFVENLGDLTCRV